MRINIKEVKIAANALKGVSGCESVLNFLKEVIRDNQGMKTDLINREAYIESILWSEEDIKAALKKEGYESSPGNIAVVCNSLGDSLSDLSIESGWDVIYAVISNESENLKRGKHNAE